MALLKNHTQLKSRIHSKHQSTSFSTVIMCWAIVTWTCGHIEEGPVPHDYYQGYPDGCPGFIFYGNATENKCSSCETEDAETSSKEEASREEEASSKGEEEK
ncbi:MAG: hypothetical protein FRX48_04525 [Lasallia pustulata]|uniref:Uncharacterized protein n=1 Tax=Lasallia pustulata TaxID=136370 RepID=A0A5M8PQL9_9LECA|nr:MAG: hypothetical protein FRX48_04525 [Lasallia pustulata]